MNTEFYKHIELDSELEEIISLLNQNNIPFEVFSADVIIDKSIVGTGFFPKYTLKLLPKDFQRANQIIREENEKKDIRVEDYKHISQLSDEELYSILENPSEWTNEAEIVARKILHAKGINISESELTQRKELLNQKLKKGKSVSIGIQILYFLIVIFGIYFHIILVFAGIIMGYYYTYGKDTDCQGEKYYIYDEKARRNGRIILYGGIIGFIIHVIVLVKKLFYD